MAKGVEIRNRNPIRLLLSRPISFHPVLVDVCEGSLTAALFLSQAIYYSEATEGDDGWFWKKSKEWENETKLSRHQQDNAREILRKVGFLSEELRNSPPVMHYKVNFNLLESAILNMTETDKFNLPETDKLDDGNRQIELLETDKSYKEAKTTTKTTTKNIYKTFVLPEWIDTQIWNDFEAMRKKQKKPMTERAKELVITELDKLRNRGHPPNEVLEQSIRNCWQDVFELRNKVNGNGQQQTSKAERRNARISETTRRVLDPAKHIPGYVTKSLPDGDT